MTTQNVPRTKSGGPSNTSWINHTKDLWYGQLIDSRDGDGSHHLLLERLLLVLEQGLPEVLVGLVFWWQEVLKLKRSK